MSPEFTAKEPGTYGTSTHVPAGMRTWSPGTSLWRKNLGALHLEEERIDRRRHRGRVVERQERLRVEVGIALIGDPVREVRRVRRVVRGEDPVEVGPDRHQVVVVAQVRVEGLDGHVRRRRGQDQVVPGRAVRRPAEVALPAAVGAEARELLVEEADGPGAVDGQG